MSAATGRIVLQLQFHDTKIFIDYAPMAAKQKGYTLPIVSWFSGDWR
jgi:hypothetical protein